MLKVLLQLVQGFRLFLRRLHDALAPPELVATEHMTGFWRAAALGAATNLKVADHLSGKLDGMSVQELALHCGADPNRLRRLLTALASIGFFQVKGERVFHTRLSACLSAGSTTPEGSGQIGKAVEFQYRVQWKNWNELAGVIKTGLTSSALRRGLEASDPEAGRHCLFREMDGSAQEQNLFHGAMESVTELSKGPLAQAFPWEQFSSIVDLGGGSGAFLSHLHTRFPQSRKTVIDRPDAFRDIDDKSGIFFQEGDFFNLAEAKSQEVLAVADLVVLKHILHDWSDEDSLRILKQIHAQISDNATLVVIETLSGEMEGDLIASFADLEMMHSFQAKERSLEDFQQLFESSGFRLTQSVVTLSPFRVLVCEKKQ